MLDPNVAELHQMAAETGSEDVLEALLDQARDRASLAWNDCCRIRHMYGELVVPMPGYVNARQMRDNAHDEVDNILRLLGRIQ